MIARESRTPAEIKALAELKESMTLVELEFSEHDRTIIEEIFEHHPTGNYVKHRPLIGEHLVVGINPPGGDTSTGEPEFFICGKITRVANRTYSSIELEDYFDGGENGKNYDYPFSPEIYVYLEDIKIYPSEAYSGFVESAWEIDDLKMSMKDAEGKTLNQLRDWVKRLE